MNNIKNIIDLVYNYLDLKKQCIYAGYENLFDVIDIFTTEVIELKEVCYCIDEAIGNQQNNMTCKTVISCYEEFLLNELADVLLTASRLISEFGLEEPFAEMVEYKYERQVYRELARYKENE